MARHYCEVCCMASTEHEAIYGSLLNPPCCPGCSCGSYQEVVGNEIARLTAELEDAAEATGVAGVDKPMTLIECIQHLRSENVRAGGCWRALARVIIENTAHAAEVELHVKAQQAKPTICAHVDGGWVWTNCPECGPNVEVDEDGCTSCGRDALWYGKQEEVFV